MDIFLLKFTNNKIMAFRFTESPEYGPIFLQLRQQLAQPQDFAELVCYKFRSSNNIELFTRVWSFSSITQKGIIVVFHGAGGDGEYYALLADKVCKHGIMVMVCDYEGHGRSEGKRGDIKDFRSHIINAKEFIEAIYNKYPDLPIFIFGESMGGIVLVNVLIEYSSVLPSTIRGLLLFSPALAFKKNSIQFSDIFRNLLPFIVSALIPGKATISMRPDKHFSQSPAAKYMNPLHIEYDMTDKMHLEKVSARFVVQLNRFANKAFEKGANFINKPLLLVLADHDAAVDIEAVKAFYQRIPESDKTLIVVERGPHALFTAEAFQPYWNQLIQWISDHIHE